MGLSRPFGDDHIGGDEKLDPPRGGLVHDRPGGREHLVLDQGPTDLVSLGLEKGVGHPAADEQGLDAVEQGLEGGGLGGDLGAADHRDKRLFRVPHHPREGGDLGLHEKTGGLLPRAEEPWRGRDRGVRPVGGAEGVVDIVREGRRQLRGEFGIIGLLARVEAEVLQQQEGAGLGVGDGRIEAVLDKTNRAPEGLGEDRRHRGQAVGRVRNPLGLAEVGAGGDHRCPLAEPPQRRQRGDDPGVVLDHPVGDGHVEVEAGQDPGALDPVEIREDGQGHELSFSAM